MCCIYPKKSGYLLCRPGIQLGKKYSGKITVGSCKYFQSYLFVGEKGDSIASCADIPKSNLPFWHFFCLWHVSMMRKANTKLWVNIPPWIILGAVLILVPLFLFMTIENISRQKGNTTRLLVEKGAALIRSFEAGARTGMMGMRWRGGQVQSLLTETARQPDIVYLLVTDDKGAILAHNDASKIGKTYGEGLDFARISHSQKVEWRQVVGEKGSDIFEVFRRFAPTDGYTPTNSDRTITNDWCECHINPESSGAVGQVIFVGLDMGPIETARREDTRHTVVMAAILLLIAFAGIVSLFLAQAYRSTRTSLSRVKAFSDSLVENMPIGLLAIDTDGKIASFNQTSENVLQLSSKEVLGRRPEEVLSESLLDVIEQLRTGKRLVEKEMKLPIAGGKVIPMEVIATFLEEESGSFLGYVILFRDLTEIQHLKNEVVRSQRLASIGRLAAGVAHEIRNPLSSIKGFATYFRERYRDIPEDQKTAEVMIQEVERLNRVIGQLLELARPMSIKKKPTSLQGLVQHTIRMIQRDAERNRIETNYEVLHEISNLSVDPDSIKQVLLNLFLNAVEAMDKGGTLSVELNKDPGAENVQIIISDTGNGIIEEDLAHIFDPYFTTKPSGTGLGLAVVYKIIEAHGGEIEVKSHRGVGTTVTVSLPYTMEV